MAPASLGNDFEKVPLRAASRLNGKTESFRDDSGGSIRENGADTRRFLSTPEALRLGERPAGAVSGARGDGTSALAGVVRRDGSVGGGGIELDGERVNVNGLNGFSKTSFLFFLDGEQNTAGSTFSLSTSSKVEGSNGLFDEKSTGLEIEALALPLYVEICAVTPRIVSTRRSIRVRIVFSSLAYHFDGS